MGKASRPLLWMPPAETAHHLRARLPFLLSLQTMLLPMDVLASKAGKAGSSTGGSGGGGGRSSHGSDKCQLSLQDEAPAPPLAVHVSTGFSADGERALPAPTKAAPRPPAAKGWSIGAGAAVGSADPATPAAIHITADCRSSVGQALRLGGPGSASSPLEIASSAASGSSGHRGARKTALVPTAVASGAGGAAAAEMSVWQGLKGLLADVDVAVFLFLAFLMGSWARRRRWRQGCGQGGSSLLPRCKHAAPSASSPSVAGIGNGSIGFLFLFLDKWGEMSSRSAVLMSLAWRVPARLQMPLAAHMLHLAPLPRCRRHRHPHGPLPLVQLRGGGERACLQFGG